MEKDRDIATKKSKSIGLSTTVKLKNQKKEELSEALRDLAESNDIVIVDGSNSEGRKLNQVLTETDHEALNVLMSDGTYMEDSYEITAQHMPLADDVMYSHLTRKENEANIQPIRKGEKIKRNSPCPCGSRKKYKKCCINKKS